MICGMFFACEDNFENTIKKENNATDNTNGNPGVGWTKIAAYITTPRAGASALISGDYLYFYGGENALGIYGDFGGYNLQTNSYETLPSFGAIAYSDMVILDGILYIFGGMNSSKNPTRNLKCYDILNKTWSEIPGPSGFNGPMPSEIYSHVTLSYTDPVTTERMIFVHGGFGDKDGTLYRLTNLNTAKPDWEKFADINLFLAEHAAIIHNDKIYFFGGIDPKTSEYQNDLYVFDIQAAKSIPLPFAKLNPGGYIIPRSGMKMIAANNGLYVYGGKNASGILNDLWFYSFSNNRWEYIGVGPGKRCHYNAFINATKLLIYGGNNKDNSGHQIFYCDLWEYQLN